MNRVSARPPNANSFQSLVPTGNFHTSGSDPSMNRPFGMRSQRDFVAPSDQRGYWGLKGRLPGTTVFVAQSAYSPVSRSVGGGQRLGYIQPFSQSGSRTRATPRSNGQTSVELLVARENSTKRVRPVLGVQRGRSEGHSEGAERSRSAGTGAPGPSVIHSRDMRQTLTT